MMKILLFLFIKLIWIGLKKKILRICELEYIIGKRHLPWLLFVSFFYVSK